jgi:hypothetical protein
MGKKGPNLTLLIGTSILRDDETPACRTQSEMNALRQNAKAAIAFGNALAASSERFEESCVAAMANLIGKPPHRDIIPATNASSLYSSSSVFKSRKR